MGFGSIVSQVVLFMSVMIVIIVLSVVYKTYVTTTNNSLKVQHERVVEKIDTDFEILDASYDKAREELTLHLKNSGSLKLEPTETDLFVGAERISRDDPSKELLISDETNIVNPGLWDPGEILELNVSRNLNSGYHSIKVSIENGITRSTLLEVF
jgi:archaellum component FlaG (FlaF/FlaG flagellin family)